MTPDQLAALHAIASILEVIGTWKAGTLIAAIILMPSVLFGVAIYLGAKWMKALENMYKNNVKLVENYDGHTGSMFRITENLQDLVILTTGTMEKLVGKIENNLYCPLVRQKARPMIEEEKKQ